MALAMMANPDAFADRFLAHESHPGDPKIYVRDCVRAGPVEKKFDGTQKFSPSPRSISIGSRRGADNCCGNTAVNTPIIWPCLRVDAAAFRSAHGPVRGRWIPQKIHETKSRKLIGQKSGGGVAQIAGQPASSTTPGFRAGDRLIAAEQAADHRQKFLNRSGASSVYRTVC